MPIFFQVCFCYLGALIGAGFASGKEIQLFFGRFSSAAYPSLLFAGILFAFFAYAAIEICRRQGISSSVDFFVFCLGERLGLSMLRFLQLFLFFSVTVMIAAGDSLFQIFFLGAPGWGGILLCCFLFVFLLRPQKGMVIINTILVPILLVMLFSLWYQSIDLALIHSYHESESFSVFGYIMAGLCFMYPITSSVSAPYWYPLASVAEENNLPTAVFLPVCYWARCFFLLPCLFSPTLPLQKVLLCLFCPLPWRKGQASSFMVWRSLPLLLPPPLLIALHCSRMFLFGARYCF